MSDRQRAFQIIFADGTTHIQPAKDIVDACTKVNSGNRIPKGIIAAVWIEQ